MPKTSLVLSSVGVKGEEYKSRDIIISEAKSEEEEEEEYSSLLKKKKTKKTKTKTMFPL